jgi:hypothetical protein
MDTLVIKPHDDQELNLLMQLLRKMKVRVEVFKEPSSEDILKSIEGGAKETSAFLKGKTKLKDANNLLNEL